DDAPDRRGWRPRRRGGLGHGGGELLDEERVAAGGIRELRGGLVTELAEPELRQLLRLRRAERSERQRRVGGKAAAPRRSRVEQVGPGQRQQQHRNVAQARREQLHEVEQAAVCHVDVLELESRRLYSGDG